MPGQRIKIFGTGFHTGVIAPLFFNHKHHLFLIFAAELLPLEQSVILTSTLESLSDCQQYHQSMFPISMLLYFSSDRVFAKASLIGADCAGSTTFPFSRDFGRTSLGVAMKPTVHWALADANVHRTAFRLKSSWTMQERSTVDVTLGRFFIF